MAKPILLSVDDDPDVLGAIGRDLRAKYGAEYRVIGSESRERPTGPSLTESVFSARAGRLVPMSGIPSG